MQANIIELGKSHFLLTDVTQNGVYYYEAVRKVIFVISKEQRD